MSCSICANSIFDSWINNGAIATPAFRVCDVCMESPVCLDCSVKCIVTYIGEESVDSIGYRCKSCVALDNESGIVRIRMPEVGNCTVCEDGIWKLSACDICEKNTFCSRHVVNISVMRRRIVESIISDSAGNPINNICHLCNKKRSKHYNRQMMIKNKSAQTKAWLTENKEFVESEREKYIKRAEAKWEYKRIKMAINHSKI